MDPNILDISIDENDGDTSQDDIEEDDDEGQAQAPSPSKTLKTHPHKKSKISKVFSEFSLGDCKLSDEFREWERSKVLFDRMFFSSSPLIGQPEPFQFFVIDSVSTISPLKHPSIHLDPCVADLPLNNVIRLFGVTTIPREKQPSPSSFRQDGDDFGFSFSSSSEDLSSHDQEQSVSVCCNVHGFLSYFYAMPIAVDFDSDEASWKLPNYLEGFKALLEQKVKKSLLNDMSCTEYHEFLQKNNPCIAKIQVMKSSEEGVYLLDEVRSTAKSLLLKIYCSLPRFIWAAGSLLNSTSFSYKKKWKFECFEANINSNIRFITDRNIFGCSWYQLLPEKYFVRNSTENPLKKTHCQIELDVSYEDIVKLPDDHERYRHKAAVRVLSFDIEVMVSPDELDLSVDATRQVIQISSIIGNYFSGADSKCSLVGKTVFVLGSCDAIKDVKVIQFYIRERPESTNEEYLEDAEAAMLEAWRHFVVQMDPDIILGYNVKNFDLPYLIDRANSLWNHKSAQMLPYLGRLATIKSGIREILNPFKKVTEYDRNNVNIQGRVILDLYALMHRHDLRRGKGHLKLKNVAKRLLQKGEEKQDVSYKEIEGLQHGTSETRSRMAKYCVQDAMIPYLLLFQPVPGRKEDVTFLDLYFQKSRDGGTLLRYLFNKSVSYNAYFRQVRQEKNPGKGKSLVLDTPSPKKPLKSDLFSTSPGPSRAKKKLFTEEPYQEDSGEGSQ